MCSMIWLYLIDITCIHMTFRTLESGVIFSDRRKKRAKPAMFRCWFNPLTDTMKCNRTILHIQVEPTNLLRFQFSRTPPRVFFYFPAGTKGGFWYAKSCTGSSHRSPSFSCSDTTGASMVLTLPGLYRSLIKKKTTTLNNKFNDDWQT